MGAVRKINISKLEPGLAGYLSRELAVRFCVLPLKKVNDSLVILTPDGKKEAQWLAEIQSEIGLRPVPYAKEVFSAQEIKLAIEGFYAEGRLKLGELLLARQVIDGNQLQEALATQQVSPHKRLGEILRELNYASEGDIQKVYAKQIGYNFSAIDPSFFLDLALVEQLPSELIAGQRVLPLPKNSDSRSVYLLTSRKLEPELLERVRGMLDVGAVEPILTTEAELNQVIDASLKRIVQQRSREMTLGEILLEKKMISREQLQEAVIEQRRTNTKLGEILMARGILSEDVILKVISEKLRIGYLTELPAVIDREFKEFLTEKFTTFNKVVPIGREGRKIVVAMVDPQDNSLLDLLRNALKADIKPVLTTRREIMKAIHSLYREESEEADIRIDLKRAVELKVVEYSDGLASSKRIINLINNILVEGVERRASDIHFTPKENSVDVFFRIDGDLRRIAELPVADRDNIISRIKIMGDMRIDARHITQSGRIVARVSHRHIDFRISVLPTQFGENVVMRILDSSKLLDSDFGKLGMPEDIMGDYIEQCRRAQGIVLVVGPTGSGKTTTLYHTVNWLHARYPHKSISTIENPIEYVVDGIIQSEVNESRGLTYASILKEKLRQDPDIIMVGEIRYLEEAQLAFTAALTGHYVLSTLHTNDGATTVRRLIEMGMEPYNVSSAINCILSQRLAKRNCMNCLADYEPTPKEAAIIRRTNPDFDPGEVRFKQGTGCGQCTNGRKGRIGIYELLLITPEIKHLISRNATDSAIRDAAIENGMKTLRMAALDLAFDGIISLRDVLEVTDIIF